MSRDHRNVGEGCYLRGLRIRDPHAVDRSDQPVELIDGGRGIAGIYTDVSAERGISRLLVGAAHGDGRVVVGPRRGIIAQERVRVSELYEQNGIARIELVASRVFLARFGQVALRPVDVTEQGVGSSLVRRQGFRLLHVLQRLGEIARLPEQIRQAHGGVPRVQAGCQLQALGNRGPRLCVVVHGTLHPGEGQPGARAVGIFRDQLPPERQLTHQVVVEPLARHLDLEAFGVRSAGRVLLGLRQVGLELIQRVRRVGDVQEGKGEARVCRDRLLEVHVRVDEAGEIELALALEEVVPRNRRGCGDGVLHHRARDGIERGSRVLRDSAGVPADRREQHRQD